MIVVCKVMIVLWLVLPHLGHGLRAGCVPTLIKQLSNSSLDLEIETFFYQKLTVQYW